MLVSQSVGFEAYVYFQAIKRHFTSNYDFFKYNGKVKANAQSFETRKDKFFFYRLSKLPEAKELILANMIKDPKIWVGELLEDKAKEIYHDWKKRKESLGYIFRQDLSELNEDDPNSDIITNGDHPKLLKLYMRNLIHIETLIILDDLMNIFSYWNKNIQDTIIWPDINTLCKNYKPFMEYDKLKMKKIILDKYKYIR